MAGIYLHIPFCKKACYYCDFHFSTSHKYKSDLSDALSRELFLRKEYLNGEIIESIYFGGGTPSLLNKEELKNIFRALENNYDLGNLKEITLEANPDDLSKAKLELLKQFPINRLSIGIQSFFDEDLAYMGRAHNGGQASASVKRAQDHGFSNITIDLIYGIQTLDDDKWNKNIRTAIMLGVPHISAYALTIEEDTALYHFIKKKKYQQIDEDRQRRQFDILTKQLTDTGFIHYEISNFAKEGYMAVHNSNYWKGKKYLGIGPSAHSYNGNERSWNIANNMRYLKALEQGTLPLESETLSEENKFNEYLMVSLRTMWGANLKIIKERFGEKYDTHLKKSIVPLIEKGLLKNENDILHLTADGKFISDYVISELINA